MTIDINTATFEMLMAELKKTLTTLENGDLPLEESMKAYETGVMLVRSAEQKLATMEGRMEQILADGKKIALDPAIINGSNDAN